MNIKNQHQIQAETIDKIIFWLIGFFSFWYAFMVSAFAEFYVQLPFLNFPIFIGEILLGLCLLLLGLKYRIHELDLGPWRIWLLAYVVWILVKALWGYMTFGPLALRNAALFYYPLFALAGYQCFRKSFFTPAITVVLLTVFWFFVGRDIVATYTQWSFLVFFVILIFYTRKKWIIVPGLLTAVYFLWRKELFLSDASRSHVVAVMGACLFLFYFFFAINFRQKLRKLLPVVGIICLIAFSFVFIWHKEADKLALKSIVDFKNIVHYYNMAVKDVAKRKGDYVPQTVGAKLYNPTPWELTTSLLHIKEDITQDLYKRAFYLQVSMAMKDYSNQVMSIVESSVQSSHWDSAISEKQESPEKEMVLKEIKATLQANYKSLYANVSQSLQSEGISTLQDVIQREKEKALEQFKRDLNEKIVAVADQDVTQEGSPSPGLVESLPKVKKTSVSDTTKTPSPEAMAAPQVALETSGSSETSENAEIDSSMTQDAPLIVKESSQQEDVLKENSVVNVVNRIQDPAVVSEEKEVYPLNQDTLKDNKDETIVEKVVLENSPVVAKETLPAASGQANPSSENRPAPDMESSIMDFIRKENSTCAVQTEEDMRKVINLVTDYRSKDSAYGNTTFRLLIWRDMWIELISRKAILGVNLGMPQRSRSLETLNWGQSDWSRDGWITPHNSFFHMIYRGGIVGLGLIIVLFRVIGKLIRVSVERKNWIAAFLISISIYWMVLSNFLVVLEFPYFAILFWSLLGMTWAYLFKPEENLKEV